jgi:hypothetical protein
LRRSELLARPERLELQTLGFEDRRRPATKPDDDRQSFRKNASIFLALGYVL